jgi:predicted phage terminase large subunit-like protein
LAQKNEFIEELLLRLELLRRKADGDFFSFVRYVGNADYRPNWHHQYMAKKINDFYEGITSRRLMLFVPSQHGKTQLASRYFPAYAMGRNPSARLVIASYSSDLAKSINNDVQKIIKSPEYQAVFPNVVLEKEKSEEFTIKDYPGSCRAVGVTGGLTGHSVDIAIIDDPVKDDIEASSSTYRERVWQWYMKVVETRLHNDSRIILIMTRWHEDDLAGRILANQPEKWQVVSLPAIREDNTNPDDPRKIGDALWPEKHSLEKINAFRRLSEVAFSSLYQQRPAPAEGNKIKREWFEYCREGEVPGNMTWDLWIDGAYTDKTANDPTGLMVAGYHDQTKKIYIKHAHDAFLEMPALLKLIPEYAELHDLSNKSRIRFEPKASGKSLRQMINAVTDFSAVEIKGKLINEGKEARIQVAAPKVESGKVVLVDGAWNDKFVTQVCSFPNAVHDEYVDLLGYACAEYITTKRKPRVTYY